MAASFRPWKVYPPDAGENGAKDVKAAWIDDVHIAFDCPFCWTKYNKDGSPCKDAKPLEHHHGSGGDKTTNRVTHRVAHCGGNPAAVVYNGFNIFITPDTVRK